MIKDTNNIDPKIANKISNSLKIKAKISNTKSPTKVINLILDNLSLFFS